jgi:hypothetical protein
MHDDSIHPQSVNHESPAAAASRELDLRLIRALETSPIPQIPDDFAARVTSRLPAPRPLSIHATRYGYYVMIVSMVVLLVTLLMMARNTVDHSTLGLTLQYILCAQFIGIGVWISARRHNLG